MVISLLLCLRFERVRKKHGIEIGLGNTHFESHYNAFADLGKFQMVLDSIKPKHPDLRQQWRLVVHLLAMEIVLLVLLH